MTTAALWGNCVVQVAYSVMHRAGLGSLPPEHTYVRLTDVVRRELFHCGWFTPTRHLAPPAQQRCGFSPRQVRPRAHVSPPKLRV
jgi:hypothetical protein